MCGIYGCIADDAASKVLEGLIKLEYRGYDSAGLAAIFPEKEERIETEKTTGYVSDLVSKANGRFVGASVSIGHTRWATHGGVTDGNAHPHSSEDGNIALVHNGIIENSRELYEIISKLGYERKSETDTEVIVHLFDHELKTKPKDVTPLEAFSNAIRKLRGSWAIAAVVSGINGIFISKNGAPLVIGKGENNYSVSSDVHPFYGACSEIMYLSDGDNMFVSSEGVYTTLGDSSHFIPLEGKYDEQNPGIHKHMMMKEIHDQPNSLSNVLNGRISADGLRTELGGLELNQDELKSLRRINLVACGTAFYAAQITSFYIRELTDITCEAFVSSEFPARSVCSPDSITIGISQSGETKDTIDAVLEAKINGSKIASFCNVIGSTLSRITGNGVYLHAGAEFAVASTKVFTNMVATGLLFAIYISDRPSKENLDVIAELRKLPNTIQGALMEDDGTIQEAAELIFSSEPPIFIGRGGLSSALAREGALKMMEISYIPCLAVPGGELKHGPIALISDKSVVIAVAPSGPQLNLMESSIRECKSRGAKIILISDNEGPILDSADIVINTDHSHYLLSPFGIAVVLQKLAYSVGVMHGINVDRPRNLAKSVTVV